MVGCSCRKLIPLDFEDHENENAQYVHLGGQKTFGMFFKCYLIKNAMNCSLPEGSKSNIFFTTLKFIFQAEARELEVTNHGQYYTRCL